MYSICSIYAHNFVDPPAVEDSSLEVGVADGGAMGPVSNDSSPLKCLQNS